MTMFLAWQGSEVRRVEVDAGTVRVLLSAASVRRVAPGHGARHDDEGFVRPLAVVFGKARVQGDLASALGNLAEGVLSHADRPHRSLSLPLSIAGPVHAELVFRNGTVLQIEAQAASCALDPDSRFFESMAC